MGCLFELIFDILLEGSMGLVSWCCVDLAEWFFPRRGVPGRARDIIKLVSGIIGMVSFFALMIAVGMLFQDGDMTKTVGRYILWSALILLLLPIALWLLLWLVRHILKKVRY